MSYQDFLEIINDPNNKNDLTSVLKKFNNDNRVTIYPTETPDLRIAIDKDSSRDKVIFIVAWIKTKKTFNIFLKLDPEDSIFDKFKEHYNVSEIGNNYRTLKTKFKNSLNSDEDKKFIISFIEKAIEQNLNTSNHSVIPKPTPRPPEIMKSYPLNQILYGPPGTGKTHSVTALALAVVDPSIKQVEKYAKDTLNGGAPEVTIEVYKEWIENFNKHINKGQIEFTTFHQNYSYEDFVEGLKAELSENRGSNQSPTVSYKIVAGILKRISYRATYAWLTGKVEEFKVDDSNDCITTVKEYFKNGINNYKNSKNDGSPKPNYVLIIDEINRGNVARIFGELITLIETSKRARDHEQINHGDQPVRLTLPYTKERFILPPNLYIIGTMNTADRSLIGLDAALRRRFDFIELAPQPGLLKEVSNKLNIEEQKKNLEDQVLINLEKFLTNLNQHIKNKVTADRTIGHAYFLGIEKIEDLQNVMRRKVIPQLQEYFHDYTDEELKNIFTIQVGENDQKKYISLIEDGKTNLEALKNRALYSGIFSKS